MNFAKHKMTKTQLGQMWMHHMHMFHKNPLVIQMNLRQRKKIKTIKKLIENFKKVWRFKYDPN